MSERPTDGDYHGSEVAVIGLACRFPGARGVEEFWRLLCDGVEAITFFSDEELAAEGVDRAQLEDPAYVKAAPILDDVDAFDAEFFDYSPREAELMDPQQRLFLECAWEALEHAGYGAGLEDGAIGVFAGGKMSTYVFNLTSNPDLMAVLDSVEIGLGNDIALLSMRTSYKLDLKGPSYFVQSACSTSLVAIHLACQSLLLGECRMALAGAVAVDFPHKRGYLYREGSLGSPDGHIRAFDAGAGGTIFGSGLGAVVLKPLTDAVADGDRIYAVIKGSATNNDGSAKANFTAPSVEGEARVVLEALVNAEVPPDTISYVEAHGTGTHLGDPIELRALTKAFRAAGGARSGTCALGSVKTNLGHLDAAAGISGFIKTVLALDRRRLPPSLNFAEPNPKIDFAASPFYVQAELADWPAGVGPRRAGVSSFGFGGTNTHVVVEEAPPIKEGGPSRPWQLLVLSARSEAALEAASRNLGDHLREHPELDLADVAFTLKRGRRELRHRRAVVCSDRQQAVTALEELDPRWVQTGLKRSGERPVAFLFSGQGSQHPGMGRELYRSEAAFRRQVDAGAEILRPHLGVDLRTLLFPDGEGAAELEQTAIAQPALFVVEHALAQLWMEWGVRPRAMIGHSIGEYVAASLAGVLAFDDALALVAARGRLMQAMPFGTMLAVPLSEERLRSLLADELALAAVNGPQRCVVSGPAAAVDDLAERLTAEGVASRPLHTSHAFHSAMMDPVLEPFLEELGKVSLSPPRIPFLSNVTGTWITDEEAVDPGYWARHVLSTVRFAAGLGELFQDPEQVLLEVGPGNALTTLAREHPARAAEQPALASLPHPRDRRPELAFLLTAVGRLWLAGVEIDGAGFYSRERRRRVPLPTYPFERRRFWIAPGEGPAAGVARRVKKSDVGEWLYVPSWKRSPLPAAPREGVGAEPPSCLVFTDQLGVAAELALSLRRSGSEVVTVRPGERFAPSDDGLYALDPRRPEDYEALSRELASGPGIPEIIVHLWTLTPAAVDDADFDRMQDLGFYSLLYLAQALGLHPVQDRLRIEVVSSHLYEVVGGEELAPEKATLLGPCKVIPQEFPHLACRAIDLEVPGPGATAAEVADRLLAEIRSRSDEQVVAHRGPYRWSQTFEARQPEAGSGLPRCLRQNGVYLITGGLGGIGLVLADYLARTAGARLVLIGRSPLPPRVEWEEWLARHGEEDRTGRKLRQVRELEASGAEVLVVSADVGDRDGLRRVLRRTHERFGTLHGVIHAAGIAGGGVIQLKTRQEAERVMRPKVQGMRNLEALLVGTELDFFVLFSSISAVLGELGQVDYCAANLFLDAVAARTFRDRGTFTTAISWDTWQEVGIAVDTEVPDEIRQLREEAIRQGISNREGQEVFGRILDQDIGPQVIVSTCDLAATIAQVREFTRSGMLAIGGGGHKHPRPALETAYAAPEGETEQTVATLWQEVLGLEQLGRDDNFFDLGGHSLLATQLMSRLRGSLGIDLPMERLFEAPTVAGLAAEIEALRWAALGQEGLGADAAAEREEGEL